MDLWDEVFEKVEHRKDLCQKLTKRETYTDIIIG
jgi:hypothetical protein